VTCTADPNVKNTAYAGGAAKGGDSAWRMRVPAFADELRFQSAKPGKVATFSLKARAAITMAGHKADAAAWFDGGSWETSNPYGTMAFIENYVKANPVQGDFGKSWELSLPKSAYAYNETAHGAMGPGGWSLNFPHALKGASGASAPDAAFYEQWASSPFADTYLTKLAEEAVDQMGLGRGGTTDFLGISYSSVDYVGHAFGPRSWEIQDVLIRLDKDLGELFARLDAKVGRYNYVVALSADHGVVPIPEDMEKTGADAGVLHTGEVQEQIEQALIPLGFEKPVARIASTDVYFAPHVYDRLRADGKALRAAMDAIRGVAGVLEVYRAEEVQDWPETQSPIRAAEAASYFAGRSGDLLIVPKPYYLVSSAPAGKSRDYGTGHGTPYYYDQHVPLFLMGWGIQPGDYFGRVTPADIAPTLAELCGITLSSSDGRVLAEALK
jgi:predicted AlkP superfamily pyrophosphatase or phosphodiesterase